MPELDRLSKSHAREWNKLGERVRRDFLMQAIAGTIPGVCVHRVAGIDDAVLAGTTPVWPGAGQYPYFPDADTVQLVSDNAGDTYNGAGAWLVRIHGLDQNYEMQMEDVTLRGATPVLTQGEYTHVYHATVLKGGTLAGTLGTITITGKTNLLQVGFVSAPANTMLNGVFIVPAHTNAYMFTFHFNVESVQNVIVRIRYTTPTNENRVWVVGFTDITSGGHQEEILAAPFLFPPLTYVELTAEKSGGVTALVTAETMLLLIDTAFEWDNYLQQDETYRIGRPNED